MENEEVPPRQLVVSESLPLGKCGLPEIPQKKTNAAPKKAAFRKVRAMLPPVAVGPSTGSLDWGIG